MKNLKSLLRKLLVLLIGIFLLVLGILLVLGEQLVSFDIVKFIFIKGVGLVFCFFGIYLLRILIDYYSVYYNKFVD